MSLAGTRLGVYDIVSLLGAGGMGEVYRARDTKLGRDVAVKILPAAFAADPDRLARFEREARVLASLNHPNIAQIYGLEGLERPAGEAAGTDPSGSFIVMELVEGETLGDRIAATPPISVNDALAIARQIADALDAAHERGIVHRDLKPSNIVITNSPTMFGPTVDGVLLGTAPYMSPEQARGKAVDKRTDIWAFGCVVYEMLTGRRAFDGDTTSDTIVSILEREPDWTALPAQMPSHLSHLLRRCLEKDAKRRLRDIGDARTDLDESSRPPAQDPSRDSRPWLAWSLWAVTAAALVGVTALAVRGVRFTDSAPRITRAIRLTDTTVQEFGPAISPDGKWVAYYSDVRGVADVWVKFLDSGATSNLTASLDLELQVRAPIGGVDISPDGTLIAFTALQKSDAKPSFSTWVMAAPVGGQPRKLLTGLQGMRWSPDGRHLVAMRPGATLGDSLVVADADGSRQRIIVPLNGGRHIHWPAWSRDGKYIYFICTFMTGSEEPTELCRVAADGGAVEHVVTTPRRAMYPAPMADGSIVFAANLLTLDLGLWWRPASGGEPQPLTSGVGEYAETYLSAAGRRALATLLDVRQSLVRMPVRAGDAVQPRRVTDGYTGDVHPNFDATGRHLTFSSSRSGDRGLWLARPDGTQPTPLTSGAAIDDRPAFSPDGSQIAFVSGRDNRQGIWVVSTDGGPPRLIGEATVLDTLTWSPDGKRILLRRPAIDWRSSSPCQLRTGALRCSRARRLDTRRRGPWRRTEWRTSSLRKPPRPIRPNRRWRSPTAEAVSSTRTRRCPRVANGLTAWAPDGRRVALVAYQANSRGTIWIFDPDAREPFHRVIELPVTVRVRGIAWTPDGSSLLVAEQESKSDIVLFDIASGK